mmetsp:Transcript_25729/g.70872  ORF Transcript_25729/g.70872 Transcript_25729/m.70872 type:complete len:134 (+) Transcript_25729:60-461(+)|eukprot:scaffold25882_cov25-Tisochrysis_lutea.AAC.4
MRHDADAVLALTAIAEVHRAPLALVSEAAACNRPAEAVKHQHEPENTGELMKKKKMRRATGPLRRWTAEEDVLLRGVIEKFGDERLKRTHFEEAAVLLGTKRTGYAVEQHWYLYLRPGAPKAARIASEEIAVP